MLQGRNRLLIISAAFSFIGNEDSMHSKLCGREKLVNKIPKPCFIGCHLEKEQQTYKNKPVLFLNIK